MTLNMASPQWKNYQPPVQDPAILAISRSAAGGGGGNPYIPPTPNLQQSPPSSAVITAAPQVINNHSVRETGLVEKLLHSYGFIQCCERDARLFFHFSEYNGNVDNMQTGDPVEFQMSYDRRTGKPIAVSVVKLDTGVVSCEVLGEDRVTGTVAAEPKISKRKDNSNVVDGLGRVSYQQSGECFFLPFGADDVEDHTKLLGGDEVSFFIATDKRNGTVRARNLKGSSNKAASHLKVEGVVCSMKENYGFIERSDVVKEIFFHFSEFQADANDLVLGCDVEFEIQTRNGKEVASNINKLSEGTVIFEDVGIDKRRGKIEKTLKTPHGRRQSDPLAGKIVYETLNGPIEIPFGDKDQKGDYTLQPGDIVEFNIATDRRDKLQRATNIVIITDTFKVNGELRETGVVAAVKDGFGFIRCADRDARMFFHFSEMIEHDRELKVGEETEFTVIQDPTSANRQIALRIRCLEIGTVEFEKVNPKKHTGSIEKEPTTHKSQAKNKDPDPGIIMYEVNGTKQTIPYSGKNAQYPTPKYGDKVEFQICEVKRTQTQTAVSVKVLSRNNSNKLQGFIATLKDNFGFIETADHDREVFFHFSAFEGETGDLDLGDEVEFTLARKTAKVSAESIRKLPKGSVAPEEVQPGLLDGRIVRCMRIINPEQDEYPGIVQIGVEDDVTADRYTYGVTSLADKRDFLQEGDIVKFQVSKVKASGKLRATNIAARRKYIRAKVDSVKGQFGFLTYEKEEGKKLFFHMTEVHDNVELQPGDEVEFVVVQNQRNGKYSACSLRKITEKRRPERLMSRLKSIGDESGPKLTTIRQPKGPDGTKGFSQPRALWNPPGN